MKNFRIKKVMSLTIALILTLAMTTTAFANMWVYGEDNAWHYWSGKDNTELLKDGWYWIPYDLDGNAYRYFFDEWGRMYEDTVTPDGSTVDETGAWIVDGVRQTDIIDMSTYDYYDVQDSAENLSNSYLAGDYYSYLQTATGKIEQDSSVRITVVDENTILVQSLTSSMLDSEPKEAKKESEGVYQYVTLFNGTDYTYKFAFSDDGRQLTETYSFYSDVFGRTMSTNYYYEKK